MKNSLKRKWVEALRSGKYGQTREVLKCGNNYCCLGVLCDVYDSTKWIGNDTYLNNYGNPANDVELNDSLLEEVGLNKLVQTELIKLNDEENWDFNKIAGWIENNV